MKWSYEDKLDFFLILNYDVEGCRINQTYSKINYYVEGCRIN